MPTYKVFATHQPEEELEVDDAELIDLQRQGLLVPNKGDIGRRGRLKTNLMEDPPTEVEQAFVPDRPTTNA